MLILLTRSRPKCVICCLRNTEILPSWNAALQSTLTVATDNWTMLLIVTTIHRTTSAPAINSVFTGAVPRRKKILNCQTMCGSVLKTVHSIHDFTDVIYQLQQTTLVKSVCVWSLRHACS